MHLLLGLQYFYHSEPFELESGAALPEVRIAYQINANKSNVIWVFHALTANSTHWKPDFHFISHYPQTGERYLNDFPLITIRDIVKAQQLLRVFTCLGGSMGGRYGLLGDFNIAEPGSTHGLIGYSSSPKGGW